MSEMDEREIERRFEVISQFEPSPELTARDLKRARESLIEQTTEQQTGQQKMWRITMKSKIRYKVALLGCVVIVSVTAAMTGPGVYRTIQVFLSSLAGKRIPELVELADPMSAVPHQIQDIQNLLTESEIELVSLYADDNYAIAVTIDVVVIDEAYDKGRNKGAMVITLVKRDNVWLVTDIDLETEATAKTEIDRFLKKYPNAVEITAR